MFGCYLLEDCSFKVRVRKEITLDGWIEEEVGSTWNE